MKTLKKNIINTYGESGKAWLSNLTQTIEKLSHEWHLTNIYPVKKMSWNFVALAKQYDDQLVVLKISFDQKLIVDEYAALKCWDLS
jgi:streptomycin 6-kinase